MNTETSLRENLRMLAGQAPAAAVPGDFFDRAHKRARRRWAVRGVAVMVLLLTLSLGLAIRPGGTSVPGGPGAVTVGLPRTLHEPKIWTASVEQSPPGTAAVIFGGRATHGGIAEGRFAVVAAGSDRYRVFNDSTPWAIGYEALLSPDGDLVARSGTVQSLRPDRGVSLTFPNSSPLAFSPDGTLLIYYERGPTTYVDGGQHWQSRIVVYDLVSRAETASIDNTDKETPVVAALSPDNSRLALQVRDQLNLYRLDGTSLAQYATVPLHDEALAGPGAWRPDGRSFVTVRLVNGRSWRLVPFDAITGTAEPALALRDVDARYLRVIGWRDDGTAIAVAGVSRRGAPPLQPFREYFWRPNADYDSIRARLIELAPAATAPMVLLETPDGVGELDVAAHLAIAGQFRDAGNPDYGPLPPFFVKLIAGVLPVLLLGVLVLWLALRRRRRVTQRHGPRSHYGRGRLGDGSARPGA
ncbi:hypothetical protein ACQEVZ_06230 [Dactylosporangium sp. CA-152071]|uniref:hypothetical protein n=1 Tax=Dactylosporangium sp. CA-152071 TaxID=3239933 RepID=UPI003D9331D1